MNQEILANCRDRYWLKNNHQMIHYFGLGFIQLKIDQQHRMHFYTPELPPIVPDEDIHNHRYDFESYVLKGEFEQELFDVYTMSPYGESLYHSHIKEFESCQENGGVKNSLKMPCMISSASKHTYNAGSHYFMSHRTFHRVKATNCITLLERGDYKEDLAEVIRPKDAAKVCPFSQKIETDTLWGIVEKMLGD